MKTKTKMILTVTFAIFLLVFSSSMVFPQNTQGNNFSFILIDDQSMYATQCGAYFNTSNWELTINNIEIPDVTDRYWVILDPYPILPYIFKFSYDKIGVDNSLNYTKSTFSLDNTDYGPKWVLHIPCVQVDNYYYELELTLDYLENSTDIGFYLYSYGLTTPPSNGNNGTSTQSGIKNLTLDTTNMNNFAFSFVTESYSDSSNYDISAEPWCTSTPGLCGNYVETNSTSLDNIPNIPSSGYLSDTAGFEDCANVNPNKVYINKNRDGSYTAFIITNSTKTKCDWNLTIQYKQLQ